MKCCFNYILLSQLLSGHVFGTLLSCAIWALKCFKNQHKMLLEFFPNFIQKCIAHCSSNSGNKETNLGNIHPSIFILCQYKEITLQSLHHLGNNYTQQQTNKDTYHNRYIHHNLHFSITQFLPCITNLARITNWTMIGCRSVSNLYLQFLKFRDYTVQYLLHVTKLLLQITNNISTN